MIRIISSLKPVITSYSIHYTKLYDAGAHNGMYLVDKQDYIVHLCKLIQNGFHPFFKLPTVFSSGNNGSNIETYHALV